MSNTFLEVPYAEKDAAKALGARWNPAMRKWYVPAGLELSLFANWLPAGAAAAVTTAGRRDLLQEDETAVYQVDGVRGVPLSQLLGQVRQLVSSAFQQGVWTLVELSQVRANNGHIYLELAERNPDGEVLATARGMIWASIAARVLPAFQQATGVELAQGIKLLVRARPSFHARFGMSLEIDAIDPDYTLGDLEATKKKIRLLLQQEGIFNANRSLPAPWDFRQVLVVSPPDAAGLGDFRAEASRLQHFGLCHFHYVHSRFQGEGAAQEVCQALEAGLHDCRTAGVVLDAVVIIRGGGAVNDLAWLNDHGLARLICLLELPVLTGIGHERDRSVLDEVAHSSFDTPSKVIAGIEQQIQQRALAAREHYQQIASGAERLVQQLRRHSEQALHGVQGNAQRMLAEARQHSEARLTDIRLAASEQLHGARQRARHLLDDSCARARQQLSVASVQVPNWMREVRSRADDSLQQAGVRSRQQAEAIFARGQLDLGRSRQDIQHHMNQLGDEARRQLQGWRRQLGLDFATLLHQGQRDLQRRREDIRHSLLAVARESERSLSHSREVTAALLREIAGQGPDKTLARGFALVRDEQGQPVTTPAAVATGARLDIQFSTGRLRATVLPLEDPSA